MVEVLGITTNRRYFTLLHTVSGAQYFDGNNSGVLSYPSVLNTYKNFPLNQSILKSFYWEGDIIHKIPHILIFDRLLEKIGVVDYKEAYYLLTVQNELLESQENHHSFIKNEKKALDVLVHWWEGLELIAPKRRVC